MPAAGRAGWERDPSLPRVFGSSPVNRAVWTGCASASWQGRGTLSGQQCPWRGNALLLPGHSCATLGCRVWQLCPHLRGHAGGSSKGSPEAQLFHPLGGAAAAPAFAEGFRKCLLRGVPPCERNARLFIFPCRGSGLSQRSLPGPQPLSVCSGEGLAAAWGSSAPPGAAVGAVTEASGSQRPRRSAVQGNHPPGQCPV